VLLGGASAAAALAWPLARLIEFSRRPDLPAGIDGTIEFTKNFPLLALIQPNFLPLTNAHRSLFTQTSLSLGNVNLVSLLCLPFDLVLLPQALTAGLMILLIAAALSHPDSRRRSLDWLAIGVIFLLPVGLGMNEWYGMGCMIPFALLLMEGAGACMSWARSLLRRPEEAFTVGLAFLCVAAIVSWLAPAQPAEPFDLLSPRAGAHFVFARPAVTRGAEISEFFRSMSRNVGIMAPQGLSPGVVYLTDKRVVALPFDPKLLDPLIEEYRISYLITSSAYLSEYEYANTDLYTSHLVSRFLFAHPERYRVVRSQHEVYPAIHPALDYYVFEVQRRPNSVQ
jgi:hypothetical protein